MKDKPLIRNGKNAVSFNGLTAVRMHRRSPTIELSATEQKAFIAAARDLEPVRGLTHGFYKYPARFSPSFVRAAIEAFSKPGDLVLDNHVGGGTTLVEALALGRNAVGIDISALAEFVCMAKTAVYDARELQILEKWANYIGSAVNIHRWSIHFADYAELGYYKHLNHRSRWRLRKAIEQALGRAILLGSEPLERFGRCVVLRTAQWALDGRVKLPTVEEFRQRLVENTAQMLCGAREFSAAVQLHLNVPRARIFRRSAIGIDHDWRLTRLPPPKVVITSPPYPQRRSHTGRPWQILRMTAEFRFEGRRWNCAKLYARRWTG